MSYKNSKDKKAYNKKYYEKHKDEMNAYANNWHETHKIDIVCQYCGEPARAYKNNPGSYCSRDCCLRDNNPWFGMCRGGKDGPFYGKHHSPESKQKLSEIAKKRFQNPENHPNWRGGISKQPYCKKWNENLRERVREFFHRECLICGKTEGENGRRLDVHHVDYDKDVCCNDRYPMFAAVCQHHNATANYGRTGWNYIFHRAIDEMFNSKSYFTKDEWRNLKC